MLAAAEGAVIRFGPLTEMLLKAYEAHQFKGNVVQIPRATGKTALAVRELVRHRRGWLMRPTPPGPFLIWLSMRGIR